MTSRDYAWQYQFEAIGTQWTIDIGQPTLKASQSELEQAIHKRIREFDQYYSRFKADSEISRMAQQAGTYTLPEDGFILLEFYKKLYDLTNGLVTPLIGQVMEQAGYDANYSLLPKNITSPPTWDEVLQYNTQSLTLLKPALLDFGAAGKGYLIDLVAEQIKNFGITNFCIDAGGDIVEQSQNWPALRVGLEDPQDTTKVIGVVELLNGSLCASAGNRRQWQDFNHIINPKTKTSTNDIAATWVYASNGLTADGLATAIFFTKPEELQSHFNFEYLIMYKDRTTKRSTGFPAKLFVS